MADEAKRIHVSRGVRPAVSTARPRGKSHRPSDKRHTASRARGLRVGGRVAPKRRPRCASVGSNTRSAGWNAVLVGPRTRASPPRPRVSTAWTWAAWAVWGRAVTHSADVFVATCARHTFIRECVTAGRPQGGLKADQGAQGRPSGKPPVAALGAGKRFPPRSRRLLPAPHIRAPAAPARSHRQLWVPSKYGQTRVGARAGMAGQSIGGTHGGYQDFGPQGHRFRRAA